MSSQLSQTDIIDHSNISPNNLTMEGDLTVVLPFEEFRHDLEVKLGRANGNVFIRKQGVEGHHDGQIMVRLKKKRFIILDYSIVPTQADIDYGLITQNIMVSMQLLFVEKCESLINTD